MLANKLIEQSNWPLTRSQWVKAVIRVWQIGFCFFCKFISSTCTRSCKKVSWRNFLWGIFSENFSARKVFRNLETIICNMSNAHWASLREKYHLSNLICSYQNWNLRFLWNSKSGIQTLDASQVDSSGRLFCVLDSSSFLSLFFTHSPLTFLSSSLYCFTQIRLKSVCSIQEKRKEKKNQWIPIDS